MPIFGEVAPHETVESEVRCKGIDPDGTPFIVLVPKHGRLVYRGRVWMLAETMHLDDCGRAHRYVPA